MIRAVIFAAAASLSLAAPAFADGRAPTTDEAAALKTALTNAGFASWSKIEFDDGKWEVDNAVHSDGKVYDVDLSKADLSIIKQDIEN